MNNTTIFSNKLISEIGFKECSDCLYRFDCLFKINYSISKSKNNSDNITIAWARGISSIKDLSYPPPCLPMTGDSKRSFDSGMALKFFKDRIINMARNDGKNSF